MTRLRWKPAHDPAGEDAAALARHLDGAGPDDAAERLRRYDAERRPRANRLLAQAVRQDH